MLRYARIVLPYTPAIKGLGQVAGLLMLVFTVITVPPVSAKETAVTLPKELDTFDQALNEAYRQLLEEKDPAAQKVLKRNQRAWLKQRNRACHTEALPKDRDAFLAAVAKDSKTTDCILEQTQARLKPLRGELQATFDRRYRPSLQASYPPYPEVWHRRLTMAFPWSPPHMYKTPDGDYLIINRTKKWGGPVKFHYITNVLYFFSGRSEVALTDAELRELRRGLTSVDSKGIRHFKDGWQIGTASLDTRSPARCPQTLNAFIFVDHKHSKDAISAYYARHHDLRKSLFTRLDSPQKVEIDRRCTDTGERAFTQYVEAKGAVFYEVLDDDTLLAHIPAGQGLMLRLTRNLESQSSLIGKELLWIPTEEIEALYRITSKTPYQDAQNAVLKKFQ